MFKASGDLRHVVKSISDLPDTASQPFNIVLNDIEFDVVARNAILLLLALEVAQRQSTCEGTDIVSSAVESMIHVWYSAYIPQVALTQLQVRVEPLVSAVCEQIATKDPEAYLGKTWKFQPGRSLRLVLKQKHWLRLREYLIAPVNLEAEEARRKRLAVTLAPERKDYQDRWYFKDASPFMRIAKERFREDGLLLPFGHPRLGFDIPNP